MDCLEKTINQLALCEVLFSLPCQIFSPSPLLTFPASKRASVKNLIADTAPKTFHKSIPMRDSKMLAFHASQKQNLTERLPRKGAKFPGQPQSCASPILKIAVRLNYTPTALHPACLILTAQTPAPCWTRHSLCLLLNPLSRCCPLLPKQRRSPAEKRQR